MWKKIFYSLFCAFFFSSCVNGSDNACNEKFNPDKDLFAVTLAKNESLDTSSKPMYRIYFYVFRNQIEEIMNEMKLNRSNYCSLLYRDCYINLTGLEAVEFNVHNLKVNINANQILLNDKVQAPFSNLFIGKDQVIPGAFINFECNP